MDKLILNIPRLQNAVAESNGTVTETREIGKTISNTNRKLTSAGTWQGDSANAYKGKAVQFDRNFKMQENMVIKMKDAMRTMLSQAEGLNRQALGFAGVVGGASSSGSKNILTYDPNAKASAINACNRAISQIDSQLDQVRKAENSLSGLFGFRVSSDLSAYRRMLNDRKNKLNRLSQAIERYASGAEAFVNAALRAFGGINESGEANATLKSWWITLVEIVNMLKGLNTGCCAFGGDPVNMATGNFVYEKEYLKVRGLFPLSFRMFYNAQEKRTGTLGPGWVHSFSVSLKEGDGVATLYMEDGHEEVFYKNENGTYTQSFNKSNKLRKTTKGFVYQNTKPISYHFDENGSVVKIEDQNGNRAVLSYEQGRPISVENSSGGSLTLAYSPDGHLVQVSDNTGRSVSLGYENGKMCSVINEEGQEQRYQYNQLGKISSIINPLGIQTLANEYDGENRILKQTFPDGGVIRYDYHNAEKELLITEQNGNEVTYVHDDRMRTTAVIRVDGTERYAYNEQNQRTWQIDKNGNETRYEYDDQGNVSQVTNALGETTSVQYNELNKPLSISLCGIERMAGEYDKQGNLLSVRDALKREQSLSYNENGQPVRMTQPDGSVTELLYDGRGNIISIIDEGASETTFEYDNYNRVIVTIDPNGNKTCFDYNRRDELIKVVNAEGNERLYEYNQAGKLIKVTDFDGGVSFFKYSAMNKLTRFIDPGGHETHLEYDEMLNVIKQTDANGAETRYYYDALQRLVKVSDALGHSMGYDYDPNGNRTCVTNPYGEHVCIEYDVLNRMTNITDTDGAKTAVTYNEMGQVTSVTDAMGYVRATKYDVAGQKIEETDRLGNKTVYTYTPLGKISTVTDSAGRVTSFDYLPGGLLSRENYPDGCWIRYEYDAAKNLVLKQDQSGYTLAYSYDSMNRIIKITSSQGQEKHYTYNSGSYVTSMTDANGSTMQYIYSAAGKLIGAIDAKGDKTEYDYDDMGELIQIKRFGEINAELSEAKKLNESNLKLQVTTYHRNLLGQIEQIEDALGHRESYTYDAFGRVTSITDKDNYTTQYAYGENEQLEHIQYADGKSVRLSYDPLRRLTEIQDWLGVTSIETDPLGRITRVRDHNGKEVEYRYGSSGERRETVYPDGKRAMYQYDNVLRLTQLTYGDNTVSYAYDKNSRLREKQFSNGILSHYDYNEIGLLASLTHSDSEGILDRYQYQYDLAGNKTSISKFRRGLETDSGQFDYDYDVLGRISGVYKDENLLRAYSYDAFGNRSRMIEGDEQTAYSFNSLNQLVRVETSGLTRDYKHDARGNVTGVSENGIALRAYEFGASNRLEKAVDAEGQVSLYQYNGLGQRVGHQITNGLNKTQAIDYVLDLTRQYHNLLQTCENDRTNSYFWDFNVVSESGSEGDRFYLQDELGSPLRFTGGAGTLVDSYIYDEFGNDLSGNQGVTQPFGYTGYRYDNLAGTYFAQAREYSPEVGRFSSVDVIKGSIAYPMTINEYTYCLNSPMSFVDFNGQVGFFEGIGKGISNLLNNIGNHIETAGRVIDVAVDIAGKSIDYAINETGKWINQKATIIGNAVSDFWNSEIYGVDTIHEVDLMPGFKQSLTVHTGGRFIVHTVRVNGTNGSTSIGLKINTPTVTVGSVNTSMSLVWSGDSLGFRGVVHDTKTGMIAEGTVIYDNVGRSFSVSAGEKFDNLKRLVTYTQRDKTYGELLKEAAKVMLVVGAVAVAAVVVTYLVVNDVSIIGVLDDVLIPLVIAAAKAFVEYMLPTFQTACVGAG